MKIDWAKDISASFVVFLVALPLCMGIAIASGMPPAKGLLTGIIGGIVVGMLSGSPLQVSGPAAGLAVIVFDLVHEYGAAGLGPILLLAGSLQLAGGLLKTGRWFRAISPAVIHGMLAGIGILIVLQQFHVMLDHLPRKSGPANLAAAYVVAMEGIFPIDGSREEFALLVGLATIAGMLGWQRFCPERLKLLPGALIGILAGTGLAHFAGWDLKHVEVPSNLLSVVDLPRWSKFPSLDWKTILGSAIAVAFIASAETLLSAAAVDKMQTRVRTDYDRELSAQGIGNMLCGLLGAPPMTGVIVRSSANVQAGAETRWSAVLHGVWLLAFVALLPGVLRLVPVCSLAAVLVVTGIRLVHVREIKRIADYGRMPILIYAATLLTIVMRDLLTGVLVGVVLSLANLLWRATHLKVELKLNEQTDEWHLTLAGSATFMRLPQIAEALDRVPRNSVVKVQTAHLHNIDHACLELLEHASDTAAQHNTRFVVKWESLRRNYWSGPVPAEHGSEPVLEEIRTTVTRVVEVRQKSMNPWRHRKAERAAAALSDEKEREPA